MVKLCELMKTIETYAPVEMAEEYDNVGLLVSGEQETISQVLLCLDVDEQVIKEAEGLGADLILSHHPLMFRGVNHLTEAVAEERSLRRLIQKGIDLYVAHTNLDAASGGLCDALLDELLLEEKERCSFGGTEAGVGRLVTLEKDIAMEALLEKIRKAWEVSDLSVVGERNKKINTIGFCNGGGGDLTFDAYNLGADLYISGDFKYHHARFAYENGLSLICVSHYDAEKRIFCKLIKKILTEHFGSDLKIYVSEKNVNPWKRV